jgi:hypothetical protein
VTGTTRELAATARALKARHGDLLAGACSFSETFEQTRAVQAVEAARARLQGGERPAPGQLTLAVQHR